MKNEVIEKDTKDTNMQNKLDLIKRTVAKGATNDEFNMFMYLANSYKLDPINKEIWFIKYDAKSTPTIMTSRDGYLAIANRSEHFDGLLSDVVHENDEFEKMPDGAVKHKYGCKDRGAIIGAYALGYRNDRKYPIYVFAHLSEYNKNSNVWKQYTSAMILKVAEAMMLKRLFSISGLVTKEEIDEDYVIEGNGGNEKEAEVTTKTEKVISPTNNDRPSEIQMKQIYGDIVCEECGVRVYGFKCPKCKKELKDLHVEAKGFIHSHYLTKEDFSKTGKMYPAMDWGKLTKSQAIDIYDWWIGDTDKFIIGERLKREKAEKEAKPKVTKADKINQARKIVEAPGKLEVKDENAPYPVEDEEDFIHPADMLE